MRRYERLEKIGQGSFGKVFKIRDRKSKKYFVLKEIDLSVLTPKNIREAENEVKILNVLNHQNILSFIDSYKFQGKSQPETPCRSAMDGARSRRRPARKRVRFNLRETAHHHRVVRAGGFVEVPEAAAGVGRREADSEGIRAGVPGNALHALSANPAQRHQGHEHLYKEKLGNSNWRFWNREGLAEGVGLRQHHDRDALLLEPGNVRRAALRREERRLGAGVPALRNVLPDAAVQVGRVQGAQAGDPAR